jgi:hypothetical protein
MNRHHQEQSNIYRQSRIPIKRYHHQNNRWYNEEIVLQRIVTKVNRNNVGRMWWLNRTQHRKV